MKLVKFTKGYDRWIPGDLCGFDDDVANELVVKLKVADPLEWKPQDEKVYETDQVFPQLSNLICPMCGEKFNKKSLLCNHKKIKHGIK